MTFRIVSLACVLIPCLAGCAAEPATRAIADAYKLVSSKDTSERADQKLSPDFRYLRVQVDDRVLFMALGSVDPSPDGPVEVWYSADADVLHLRDGRVVGATLKRGTNWSSVSFLHLPSWDKVDQKANFVRTRDVSPGYRYGITDKMVIKRIAPPDDTHLKNIPAASLVWFEEVVQGDTDIRPARYAVNQNGVPAHKVVYAEQCLSSEFCFSWQSWPYSNKGMP
jgi:hypothetical protein